MIGFSVCTRRAIFTKKYLTHWWSSPEENSEVDVEPATERAKPEPLQYPESNNISQSASWLVTEHLDLESNKEGQLWQVKRIVAYLDGNPTLHPLPQDVLHAQKQYVETCQREGSRRGCIASMERGLVDLDLEPHRSVRYYCPVSARAPSRQLIDVRRSSSPVLLHLLRDNDRGRTQKTRSIKRGISQESDSRWRIVSG